MFSKTKVAEYNKNVIGVKCKRFQELKEFECFVETIERVGGKETKIKHELPTLVSIISIDDNNAAKAKVRDKDGATKLEYDLSGKDMSCKVLSSSFENKLECEPQGKRKIIPVTYSFKE